MNITKENIETFLIDWLDGNLSQQEQFAVSSWLQMHPEIAIDFEQLLQFGSTLHLVHPEPSIDFQQLKKPETISIDETVQEQLIAYLEGDMALDEQLLIAHQLTLYPELKSEEELLSKTFLQPHSEVTHNWDHLKKKGVLRILIPSIAAVAAIFFIGWLLQVMTQGSIPVEPKAQTAQTKRDTSLNLPLPVTASNKEKLLAIGAPRHQLLQQRKAENISGQKVTPSVKTPFNQIERRNTMPLIPGSKLMYPLLKALPISFKTSAAPAVPVEPKQLTSAKDLYLTPRQWLRSVLHKRVPMLNIPDSVLPGRVNEFGAIALNVLNQTTGIQITNREEQNKRSFHFQSRLIEIEHTY